MERDPDEHVHPGQEDLRWGSGIKDKERKKGHAPTAKYNKFSEQARRLIAGESQCAMFCGGKKCKYCTTENWKPEQMAIKGLYSEWVTDNILAMARPSNHGFDNLNILEQFIENNIKTVINLQQPGEHASCGYGNDDSGFSYNPQRMMEKDIFFYNFAWQDYGIAPMSTLLDIVKVMQFAVFMGKVAVHCHAGLGRTGLLIACYLVYNNRVPAGEAVHYVRSRRAGAIQTSQQVQTVYDFETHLKPFRTVFPSKIPGEAEVSFKHFLNRQSHMIHGFEARRLKHIPKVIYTCCERLLELAGRGHALSKASSDLSNNMQHLPKAVNINGAMLESRKSFSQLSVHSDNNMINTKVPLDSNVINTKIPLKVRNSVTLEDLPDSRFKKVLMEGETEDESNSSDGLVMDDDTDVFDHAQIKDHESVEAGGTSDCHQNHQRKENDDQEEEDDDDCIVFGRPDIVAVKDTGNNVEETRTEDVREGDGSVQRDVLDLHQQSESSSLPDSHSTTDGTKTRRTKKRKGLGQRLKGRSKQVIGKGREDERWRQTGEEVVKGEKNGQKLELDDVRGSGHSGRSSDKESNSERRLDNHDEGGQQPGGSSGSNNRHSPSTKGMLYQVCVAMAATEYSAAVREKADTIEVQLNETDSAWSTLAKEEDPNVLSAVFWDWLNQLKEPVLRRQDLIKLLERSENPRDCLHHLEKSVKHFIEYIALVMSKMFPQPEDLETRLIEHLLSHLTHQLVTFHLTSFNQHSSPHPHWGDMRNSQSGRLVEFFFKLIDQMATGKQAN